MLCSSSHASNMSPVNEIQIMTVSTSTMLPVNEMLRIMTISIKTKVLIEPRTLEMMCV